MINPETVLPTVRRPIPDRIVREGLIEGQRMRGRGNPIQCIVAEILHATAVRQARPIADSVIDIVCFVDLRTGRDDLVQEVGDLARRIVGVEPGLW